MRSLFPSRTQLAQSTNCAEMPIMQHGVEPASEKMK